MLAVMASGDLCTVKGLAALVRDTETNVSKHLGVLRRAGITKFGVGRLHQIADAYRLAPGVRELDLGYLVIRLPDAPK
jgi:hypothetical protein